MDYRDWLLRQQTIAPSTVKHYVGAVYGRLSNLYGEPLYEIHDIATFTDIIERLKKDPAFQELNSIGHRMYSAALANYMKYLEATEATSEGTEKFEPEFVDMEAIAQDTQLLPTEKVQLIHARLGQGLFRAGLMKIWHGRCSVTGYADSRLLIASHIKPWCRANNKERLDPYNGFLLTPTLDKVFDRGLITFDPRKDGKILFSQSLKDIDMLHLTETMSVPILNDSLAGYLSYHKKYIFLP